MCFKCKQKIVGRQEALQDSALFLTVHNTGVQRETDRLIQLGIALVENSFIPLKIHLDRRVLSLLLYIIVALRSFPTNTPDSHD